MIASWIVKRMVRSTLDKVFRGDIESALAKWAKDSFHDFPSNPYIGDTIKERKEILDWHYKWFEPFADRNIVVKDVAFAAWPLSPSNVVMAEWTCEGTDKEGKKQRYDGVSVIHIKNFKIVKWMDHFSCKVIPQLSSMMESLEKT